MEHPVLPFSMHTCTAYKVEKVVYGCLSLLNQLYGQKCAINDCYCRDGHIVLIGKTLLYQISYNNLLLIYATTCNASQFSDTVC